MKRRIGLAASVLGLAMLASACTTGGSSGGGGSNPTASGSGGGGNSGCGTKPVQASGKVAVILQATAASGRWEAQDRPRLIKNISKYAPKAKVLYSNGEGVAANQLSQAEAAISAGAKVIVVAPVDGVAAGEIARRAKTAGVKFIAYDAPVQNAAVDYYVSFDNVKVGGLMGNFIKDNTKQGDTITVISGAPQDDNAAKFQQGALNVLQPMFKDGSRKLGYKTFTPNWDLTNAQREMDQALSKLKNNVQGVVAANDNLATGVINSLRAQGLAGKVPVTGQDATATGLLQIVEGAQGMTVYKPIEQEANATGKLVACALAGQAPPAGLINAQVDNGGPAKVPSVLLQPIKVTKDNIATTVVKDGFVSWAQICKGAKVKCPPAS